MCTIIKRVYVYIFYILCKRNFNGNTFICYDIIIFFPNNYVVINKSILSYAIVNLYITFSCVQKIPSYIYKWQIDLVLFTFKVYNIQCNYILWSTHIDNFSMSPCMYGKDFPCPANGMVDRFLGKVAATAFTSLRYVQYNSLYGHITPAR